MDTRHRNDTCIYLGLTWLGRRVPGIISVTGCHSRRVSHGVPDSSRDRVSCRVGNKGERNKEE